MNNNNDVEEKIIRLHRRNYFCDFCLKPYELIDNELLPTCDCGKVYSISDRCGRCGMQGCSRH